MDDHGRHYPLVGSPLKPEESSILNWPPCCASAFPPIRLECIITYENQIIQQGYTPKLPTLSGPALENMALLLYGSAGSPSLSKQYYIPTCSGKIVNKYTWKGANWTWTENSTGNKPGTDYADGIIAK
jgi:hypothetical protein